MCVCGPIVKEVLVRVELVVVTVTNGVEVLVVVVVYVGPGGAEQTGSRVLYIVCCAPVPWLAGLVLTQSSGAWPKTFST